MNDRISSVAAIGILALMGGDFGTGGTGSHYGRRGWTPERVYKVKSNKKLKKNRVKAR
jgi:hypothetical protein